MPDWLVAVIAFLQSRDAITAICPVGDIRQQPPQDTGAPRYAISVQRSGGFGAWPSVPYLDARVDLRCYGPTAYDAMTLWRTVQTELEGDRRRGGFTAAGCRVLNITLSSGPVDNLVDEGWPMVLSTHDLLVSETAVV